MLGEFSSSVIRFSIGIDLHGSRSGLVDERMRNLDTSDIDAFVDQLG